MYTPPLVRHRWTLMRIALLVLLALPAIAFGQVRNTNGDPSLSHKGILITRPAPPETVGLWVVGDKTFAAGPATTFPKGQVAVGDCVEVEYLVIDNQNRPNSIKPDDTCGPAQGDNDIHGIVSAFPPNLVGIWIVGGESYLSTPSTHFAQNHGPFAVGSCVELHFTLVAGQRVISDITTDDSCTTTPGSPPRAQARGILRAFPPAPRIGLWQIGDLTYAVTPQTELHDRHGEFHIGACVQVVFNPQSLDRAAYGVETEGLDDCGSPQLPPGALVARGIVSARPADTLFGNWAIGGQSFNAISGTTSFRQENGLLRVGVCAVVAFRIDGAAKIALVISSAPGFACAPPEEEHETFGKIEVLPSTAALTGTWKIGGLDYRVTGQTKLEGGPFVVGLLVKVNFVRNADGTLVARKIVSRYKPDDDDRPRHKVIGRITTLPATGTLSGTWIVGSQSYTVTARTRLRSEGGSFNVGECVAVYFKQQGGQKVTLAITELLSARCDQDPTGHEQSRAFGFVGSLPDNSFIGTWLVGDALYEANAQTEFEAEHGAFSVGAFVEVVYVERNGVKVALKIATHVPPGAGDDNSAGTLSTSQTTLAATSQTWYIAGQAYQIGDATILDESNGALTTGQRAVVNYYTDATGARVATQVTAASSAYLPIVVR